MIDLHRGLGDLEGMKVEAAAETVAEGDNVSPGKRSMSAKYISVHICCRLLACSFINALRHLPYCFLHCPSCQLFRQEIADGSNK